MPKETKKLNLKNENVRSHGFIDFYFKIVFPSNLLVLRKFMVAFGILKLLEIS